MKNKTETVILSGIPCKVPTEDLARMVASGLSNLLSLQPYVRELWRRFDALQPGETIHNCKSRKEFCESVLKKDPRTVRYMLNGGNPVSKRKPKTAETVSAPFKQHESQTINVPIAFFEQRKDMLKGYVVSEPPETGGTVSQEIERQDSPNADDALTAFLRQLQGIASEIEFCRTFATRNQIVIKKTHKAHKLVNAILVEIDSLHDAVCFDRDTKPPYSPPVKAQTTAETPPTEEENLNPGVTAVVPLSGARAWLEEQRSKLQDRKGASPKTKDTATGSAA